MALGGLGLELGVLALEGCVFLLLYLRLAFAWTKNPIDA